MILSFSGQARVIVPTEVATADYDYSGRYPKGLDLKPGTPLHDSLVNRIMSFANASAGVMKTRHDVWRTLDKNLTAYVPASTLETGKMVRKTTKTVIIPTLYSMLDVHLSYLVATFLEEPVFRYRWTGEEDIIGSILLERVVNLKARRAKIGLALHTVFRDALVYSFGLCVPTWTVEHGRMVVNEEVSEPDIFSSTLAALGLSSFTNKPKKRKRTLRDGVVFEGTTLGNVDPYLTFLDPNVPIERFNKGEFIGWLRPDNLANKLAMEEFGGKGYFNAKYLTNLAVGSGRSSLFQEERTDKTGIDRDSMQGYTKPIDDIEFQMRIIPSEFGLGTGSKPERWRFVVSADCVLTFADKLSYPFDNSYQAHIYAPEYDGHSSMPISWLEMNWGMADTVDFEMSSHIENVKRMINDILVYNPQLIMTQDLLNTGPGMRIRLRRNAFGANIDQAIKQLKVEDVTRGNVTDAITLMGFMDKLSNTPEARQGTMRTRGERVSATEARDTSIGGYRRADRKAKIAGMQLMRDLGFNIAALTQYMITEGTYVDLLGRGEQILRTIYGDEKKQVFVAPEDLAVQTDIEPYDAMTLLNEDPNAVNQFLQTASQNPLLSEKLDMVRLFLHAARLYGFNNVTDFLREGALDVQSKTPEQIEAETQAGNIVPVETTA